MKELTYTAFLLGVIPASMYIMQRADMNDDNHVVLDGMVALYAMISAIGWYLLPTGIAALRKHHQFVAIMITNVLLGWSGLGWVAALIWSATATQHHKEA